MAEELEQKDQGDLQDAGIPTVDEEFANEEFADAETMSDEDTDELVAAVVEALEMASDVISTEAMLEGLGVEAKGAGGFARAIRTIADAAGSERTRNRLNALSVVVSMSRPDEWSTLAGILERVAPKNPNAKKTAEKMRSEGGVGYAQPQSEYPGPQEKSSDGDTDGQRQDVEVELKSLSEQIGRIAADVGDLRKQVDTLTKALSQVATIATSDLPVPQTRQASSTSVAAALLGTLKPGS